MYHYILVAVIQVHGGNNLVVHDFTSSVACEAAASLIIKQEKNNADGQSYGYSVDCIPDTDTIKALEDTSTKKAEDPKKTDDLPIHNSHDDLPIHKD